MWLRLLVILAAVLCANGAAGAEHVLTAVQRPGGLIQVPYAPTTCGTPARVRFVRCLSQKAILEKGIAEARARGRRAIVTVGAEWCPWCIVTDAYLDGWYDATKEPKGFGTAEDADALAKFAAANFLVIEINWEGRDAQEALREIGLARRDVEGLPYYVLLRDHGPPLDLNIGAAGREKAGRRVYDRPALLRILKDAAAAVPPPTS